YPILNGKWASEALYLPEEPLTEARDSTLGLRYVAFYSPRLLNTGMHFDGEEKMELRLSCKSHGSTCAMLMSSNHHTQNCFMRSWSSVSALALHNS
ncbi:mCG62662, partial [Mus musculus]